MPVSWHSRLSVSSATAMLRTIVPSMRFAPASRSPRASAVKPALTSGGRRLSARMYSSFAASSTCVRSIFIPAAPSLHGDLSLPHHFGPQRSFFLHRPRHLLRGVGHRREALGVEARFHARVLERRLGVAVDLLDDVLRRAGGRDDAEPA